MSNTNTTISNIIRDLFDSGNSGPEIAKMLTEILNTEEKAYKERVQKQEESERAKYEAAEFLFDAFAEIIYAFTGEELASPSKKDIEQSVKELDHVTNLLKKAETKINPLIKNNVATTSTTTTKDDVERIIQNFLKKNVNK